MPGPERELSEAEETWSVIAAQQGDGQAFRRLVERYDGRLLYFIGRILGDTESAFDVLQLVWLAVHRKLRSLKSPAAFRVWLYRIAHDRAVSQLRATIREETALAELQETAGSQPVEQEDSVENAELVHRALQELSIDHRRVLTLHFLEEMRIEDIATVLDRPQGTIKSRLFAAKLALRRKIEELNHD